VHELLTPNLIDLEQPYTQEFEGMTRAPVSLQELLETRKQLIADIHSRFDQNTKRLLLSLHDGTPDFDAIDRPQAAGLPAVRWKLINLEKLKNENAAKHAEQRNRLKVLLG
jgi:hypothetical protein